MYVDECGTDDIVSCDLPAHRHLALTGVIISLDDVAKIATPSLDQLKQKFFAKADPDHPSIVLHRSDFLAAKGGFHCLSDDAVMEQFKNELHDYLQTLPHTVITVAIDKHAMLKRGHWELRKPYHYCAEVLAEKFVQYLERVGGRGDVYAESRKHKKNNALTGHFRQACENGTSYVKEPQRFADRLTDFDITFREKKHNNTGLQIADVYAKASFDHIMYSRDKTHERTDFSVRFGKLLFDEKYDRRYDGVIKGYGMKYLP